MDYDLNLLHLILSRGQDRIAHLPPTLTSAHFRLTFYAARGFCQ